MIFRSRVIREGPPSAWSPPAPRSQAAEHGRVRVVVGLGSQPDLAVLVDLVAWKAAGPRLVSYQLGRTRGAVWSSFKRSRRDEPVPPQCHRGAPEEPRRTAVRAEMAQSGETLHPATCTSWGWSWLRVGVTGKLCVKVNIPGAGRNIHCI